MPSPGQFLGIGLCLLAGWGELSAQRDPSTAEMAALLARIDREHRENPHGYLNDEMVARIKQTIRPQMALPEWYSTHYALTENLIRANRNEEAVRELDTMLETTGGLPPQVRQSVEPALQRMKGLAWLRHAEQRNCVLHHSADSCLFPIAGQGIHQEPASSGQAREALLAALAQNPEDERARWLLNVTAMTLGQFPAGVPEPYRIPESQLESDYALPRFQEIAPTAGVDINALSGGGAMEDFDGDGWLDLIVSSWSLRDQVRFLHNRGDGTFEDRSIAAGLAGITGGLNLIIADYDNDGDTDVLVLRGAWLGNHGRQPNSLLANNGDGTFTDVTRAAGLLSFHPTQTAVWWDFDGDGWLDLFIGNESTEDAVHPCELYRNRGDGTFVEIATTVGLDSQGWVKGTTTGDFNNDGRPDLYLSLLDGPNQLWVNQGSDAAGDWQFADVAAAAGVDEPFRSFPCWFWDFDNDGWEDLFVAGFGVEDVGDVYAVLTGRPHEMVGPRLYRNNRRGGFDDVSETAGLEQCWLPMGANFGDLDNDGWLDFYAATGDTPMDMTLPNKMYRNAGDGYFQDVTTAGGFGHLQKGHAVAFGDFDHDGDQDVHTVMGGAFSGDRYMNALFQNPGSDHAWLKLQFEMGPDRRSVLGTRVRVDVAGPTGTRTVYRTVSSGGSFGCNPLRLEIGLGDADKISRVAVAWPGKVEFEPISGVALRGAFRVRRGDRSAETLLLPRLAAADPNPAGSNHSHHQH